MTDLCDFIWLLSSIQNPVSRICLITLPLHVLFELEFPAILEAHIHLVEQVVHISLLTLQDLHLEAQPFHHQSTHVVLYWGSFTQSQYAKHLLAPMTRVRILGVFFRDTLL